MNPVVFMLLTAFAVNSAHADPPKQNSSGLDKFLKSMFTPTRKTEKKKSAPKPQPKRKQALESKSPPELPRSKLKEVDAEWIARYVEQEKVWDYPIPEDDQIKFKDGKYHVPSVVFKHYEDMLATPRRAPTPKPENQRNPAPLE